MATTEKKQKSRNKAPSQQRQERYQHLDCSLPNLRCQCKNSNTQDTVSTRAQQPYHSSPEYSNMAEHNSKTSDSFMNVVGVLKVPDSQILQ